MPGERDRPRRPRRCPPPPVAYPRRRTAPRLGLRRRSGAPAPAPNAAPYPPRLRRRRPPRPALPCRPRPPPSPVPRTARCWVPSSASAAWQAEVRAVAKELVANLSADYQPRVATVPIVFDPNPNDVNAFASCDDNGAPFVAATEGLLDAIDAIAQTRATDELFGTQTYQTYANHGRAGDRVEGRRQRAPAGGHHRAGVLGRPAAHLARPRDLRRDRRVHVRTRAVAPLPGSHRLRDAAGGHRASRRSRSSVSS